MAQVIVVQHKHMYGKNFFYPVNELAARMFRFCYSDPKNKRVAFTEKQIKMLREMGYEVQIQPMVK